MNPLYCLILSFSRGAQSISFPSTSFKVKTEDKFVGLDEKAFSVYCDKQSCKALLDL